jgi:hypothetical protein
MDPSLQRVVVPEYRHQLSKSGKLFHVLVMLPVLFVAVHGGGEIGHVTKSSKKH